MYRMLVETQDVVVGDSCPSQLFKTSAAMMATEIPRLPVLDKRDFDARSCLHIQRDEAEPLRRVNSDWMNRNSKSRPSASALVLARKRKRDEQRQLLNDKKQCMDSDGSDRNAADSERDSLDMEDQLTAFVEYDATDMDSLDINPSQDFDGDEEHDTGIQASQCMETCGWKDVTDVNQFQEEASEVFDNVIYAPRTASIPVANTSTSRRPHSMCSFGIARLPLRPTTTTIPEKKAVVEHASDDSEGSLSDGFDVSADIASKTRLTAQPIVDMKPSLKPESKPKWRQRRSVKRDSSFLDSSNFSVNGRLLLMALPSPVTKTTETREESSNRIIELKDGCFDLSDDVQKVPMKGTGACVSEPSSAPAIGDITPSFVSSAGHSSLPVDFQPRLVRKRRKIGQLTLDGFFRKP